MENNNSYNGNPFLKRARTPHSFTKDEIADFIKCKDDILHFASHFKIQTIDDGLKNIDLWDIQKIILKAMSDNRWVIANWPRQSGKCCHINTVITTRNKKTGEMIDMTMGDLYEAQKTEGTEM